MLEIEVADFIFYDDKSSELLQSFPASKFGDLS